MPYIKQEERDRLDLAIEMLSDNIDNISIDAPEKRAGLVNYAVTKLVSELYLSKDYKYNDLNEIIGALECCKLELYRKAVAPYEDIKASENGEVLMNVKR